MGADDTGRCPPPLRWLVVAGWLAALRLRLDLRPSTDRILGWRIVDTEPSVIVIATEGPVLSARQVIEVSGSMVTHSTVVRYDRGAARVLWAVAEPIHVRVIPFLLSRACNIPAVV